MKVTILIPVWQRPAITILCMEGMQRTVAEARERGIEVMPIYVTSEAWAVREVKRHGFHYAHEQNKPVGRKLNSGLRSAGLHEWDYLMTLGSDDLIRAEYWDYMRGYMEDKLPFFGINSLYLYDSTTNRAKVTHTGPQVIGAGRLLRRDICARMGWELWPDEAEIGLDGKSQSKIADTLRIFPQPITTHRPVVCDIKSACNLHPFDELPGTPIKAEEVLGRFPDAARLVEWTDRGASNP